MVGKLIGLVVFGGAFALLERRYRLRPAPLLRAGWKTDVLHFFLTSWVTQLLSVIPIGLVIALTNPLVSEGWVERVAAQPKAVQFLEALVLLEFTGYWAHRLMHHVPFLWRIHAVHHSSPHLDWLAAPRVHVLDEQLGRALGFFALRVVGFSPELIGGAGVVLVLWAIFLHANVRVRFPRLGRFIATPQFHHWHHSNDLEARGRNFAGFFPWIDRLFGTFHEAQERWPQSYGIDERVPDGYVKQQLYPFK
jgi:sterol desaturase/sphingolipid hydroxylase (fatty acid hydroxylase superfamily)